MSKLRWTNLGAAIVLYAAVLVYQGYQYGQGDQSQILPCLYAQDHPETYVQDHYVGQYLKSKINERTVFHLLFRYLGYDQPWVVWGWHAVLSITLILAWLRIAGMGVKSSGYQSLAVALILTVGFHTSMGSNELYYNSVVPSLAAKALASWGLYYWLKEKYMGWFAWLAVAGFLQPLVGIQLFLLTCISLILQLLLNRKGKELPWIPISLYLIATLPWIYLLSIYNGGSDDPATFMNIMEFRLSHHFFASYFGWVHLVVGGVFALMAIRFYRLRIRWLLLLVISGCIVYEMGVEIYRQPIFLYSQWWKTTIWLEAFAFIAIMVWFEKLVPSMNLITKIKLALPLIILAMVCTYRLSGWFGEKPLYIFPWTIRQSDEVEISVQAEQLTPEESVFIVPVEFTAFRWYSKRNTYIDYKAMLHQETFLMDWYRRIQDIYAYGLAEKKGGFSIQVFSNTLLEEPSTISIGFWKGLGITHIISSSHDIKSLQKVGSNNAYTIYSLK